MYVADDTATAGLGGVIKFTFDGTNWVRQYNVVATQSRSLAWDGTNLYAVTSGNTVLKILDGGSAAGSSSSVIYTGGTNTALRGIRYVPAAVPEPTTIAALGLGLVAAIKRRRR